MVHAWNNCYGLATGVCRQIAKKNIKYITYLYKTYMKHIFRVVFTRPSMPKSK